MTKTKTIHHEYGTTEIEVVECDSCGREIEKDEAYYFIMRNTKMKDEFTGQTEGWACEHCVDNPISFPAIYRTLGENTDFGDIALAICAITLTIVIGINMTTYMLLIT